MRLRVRHLALLVLLVPGACVSEGGQCLNPQPDLPCTGLVDMGGSSGAGQPGAAGTLNSGGSSNSSGAAGLINVPSEGGATAGEDAGAGGAGGAESAGAGGDSGSTSE